MHLQLENQEEQIAISNRKHDRLDHSPWIHHTGITYVPATIQGLAA